LTCDPVVAGLLVEESVRHQAKLLLEFHDKDLVGEILQILDLMLRAVSPNYLAGPASKLLWFTVLRASDMPILEVDDQAIVP
jgi:hypothetical protein